MEFKCEEENIEELANITEDEGIALSNTDRLIIGVVVGSVLFLLLILITIIVCKKRKQRGNATKRMMMTDIDDDVGDKLEMSPVMVTNYPYLITKELSYATLGVEDVDNMAANIKNHQWKPAPKSRPLPALPKAYKYDEKD